MTGDFSWGLRTGGNISLADRLVFSLQALALKWKRKKPKFLFHSDATDLEFPDSNLVKQTAEYIHDTHQDFLLNHCCRTFIFGNILGRNEKLKFDKELFAVAALLHDVGIAEKKETGGFTCNCFAVEGAYLAGQFLERFQELGTDKVMIIKNAVSLHLNVSVPDSFPEAYLVNRGAASDVIGFNTSRLDRAQLQNMLDLYPRLNFKVAINEVLKDQCRRNPASRIAFLYANGFEEMIMKSKFHE